MENRNIQPRTLMLLPAAIKEYRFIAALYYAFLVVFIMGYIAEKQDTLASPSSVLLAIFMLVSFLSIRYHFQDALKQKLVFDNSGVHLQRRLLSASASYQDIFLVGSFLVIDNKAIRLGAWIGKGWRWDKDEIDSQMIDRGYEQQIFTHFREFLLYLLQHHKWQLLGTIFMFLSLIVGAIGVMIWSLIPDIS